MAELGVISSIVGVACVGVSLSKTLYQIASNAVDADHNINRIAIDVTLFSSMLKHVGKVMGDAESLHTPEAVETAMQIVGECKSVFREVGKIIQVSVDGDKVDQDGMSHARGKRRLSMMKRLKWQFEEPKIDRMLAQLEYLKTTLSVLIQTLNLAATIAKFTAAETKEDDMEQNSEEIQQERLHVEILINARHLSMIVLNQVNTSQDTNLNGMPPGKVKAGSDVTIEVRSPELPTQESEDSTQTLVRRGHDHLDFIDRAMPDEDDCFSTPDTPPYNPLIDQLLNRWTTLPRVGNGEQIRANAEYRRDLEELEVTGSSDGFVKPSSAPIGPKGDQHAIVASSRKDKVSVATATLSPPPKAKNLDVILGPPKGVGRTSLPRTRASRPSIKPVRSINGSLVPINSSAIIQRSVSMSEAKRPSMNSILSIPAMPELNGFLNSPRPQIQPLGVYTAGSMNNPRLPLSPRHSPQSPPVGHSAMDFYTQKPVVQSPDALPKQYNPYAARVSPAPSTSSRSPFSSDDENSSEDEKRRRHRRRGARIVPWRIRIGSKFWDLDGEEFVGPRAPGESLAYLLSQPYVVVEVLNSWIYEEAIREKGYSYTRLMPGEQPNDSNQIRWQIYRPLRYKDVEALHFRTGEIFRARQAPSNPSNRQRSNSSGTHPPSFSGQIQHTPSQSFGNEQGAGSAHMPSQQQQQQQTSGQQPYIAPQQHHGGRDIPLDQPRNSFRQQQQQQQTQRPPPPTPGQQPVGTRYPPGQQRGYWLPIDNPLASSHHGPIPESRSHDRDRERDRDREEGERRERRRRERKERDREGEKNKKKVRVGTATAGTFGGIGGIAALLEGLEGLDF